MPSSSEVAEMLPDEFMAASSVSELLRLRDLQVVRFKAFSSPDGVPHSEEPVEGVRCSS